MCFFEKKEKHVYFHTNVEDKWKKVQFMIEAILADHANLIPKKHDLFCMLNTIKWFQQQ